LNELEKKSFYSFLLLYIISSALFVLLLGFWYYSAQKNALESKTYYKLEHLADIVSGEIINAQMRGDTLELPDQKDFEYFLVSVDEKSKYKEGYFEKDGMKVIISASPREHLNVAYVVVKTESYFTALHKLQREVLLVMGIVFLLIAFISYFLAKLFMRPLHNRVHQIEHFIQDVSHELNTPITALKMSSSRALQKGVYSEKILKNISISTKQLESIYNSLAFLNFKQKEQEPELVDLKEVVQNVVDYYGELLEQKKITIAVDLESVKKEVVLSRVELLFSNLLSNAIKYSMPESSIKLKLTQQSFSIEDAGVGIEKEKLQEIFELYHRQSNIAGGFGVGLNIVKQICEANNMQVDVSSELGKGSTFTIRFAS